jgi:hypothetical protein
MSRLSFPVERGIMPSSFENTSAGNRHKELVMRISVRWLVVAVCAFVAFLATSAGAQDWSQWRGDHRDAKAAEFSAPATWPKELTKKWEVADHAKGILPHQQPITQSGVNRQGYL